MTGFPFEFESAHLEDTDADAAADAAADVVCGMVLLVVASPCG